LIYYDRLHCGPKLLIQPYFYEIDARNRSKATGDHTPFELWGGKKPDVKKFRTFGSDATALRKRPGLPKWDARGENFTFVGYDTEAKAYRLWRRGTTQVVKSYDVRFIEDPRFATQKSQEKMDLPLKSINKDDEPSNGSNMSDGEVQRENEDDTVDDTDYETSSDGERIVERQDSKLEEQAQDNEETLGDKSTKKTWQAKDHTHWPTRKTKKGV